MEVTAGRLRQEGVVCVLWAASACRQGVFRVAELHLQLILMHCLTCVSCTML